MHMLLTLFGRTPGSGGSFCRFPGEFHWSLLGSQIVSSGRFGIPADMNLIGHMAVHKVFTVTDAQTAAVAAFAADAQNFLAGCHPYRQESSLEASGTADMFYNCALSRLKRPHTVVCMVYTVSDSGVPAAVPASSSSASSQTSHSHILLLENQDDFSF